jgi:hypothetical protein
MRQFRLIGFRRFDMAERLPWLRYSAAAIAFLLVTLAASAQTPRTLEEADAQRARAESMRKTAEERHIAEQNECYKKFLVNSCLEDAKKRYTQSLIEARNLDIPARDFQRDAKRTELAAKEAKREAETPKREADQKAQGAQFRSDETARAEARQQKLADKAAQATKNRQKLAAEEARRQEKAAKRAKKDAERAEQRAKKDAKANAKIEAKAKASAPIKSSP